MSNFKPKMDELRICLLAPEHCTPTCLMFQCAITGDLYASGGSEKWCKKRYDMIGEVVNIYGTFMVRFTVHQASTTGQIDANMFAVAPTTWHVILGAS